MKRRFLLCHFRESRATHGQLKGGKGVLSSLILRDNEGRHIYVASLSPLKCSFVFILKLLPRQSVTSMFVVLIISNMQVATLPHGFGVRDQSGGLKLLLFVKLFDTTESLRSIECFSSDFEPCSIAGQFVAELIGARGGAGEGDRTD